MTRDILILFLISVYSVTCMEMKETVERMVMVRTTGSDLQPAATGFIYKRNSDGPAKVIKMEEDEVLAHLKKFPENVYEQPKAFAAPIPVAAGPFYAKEEDGNKAASHASEAYVMPVVENVDDDKGDDKIDGIDEEDYGKYLGEYAADFGDYNSDFSDYLHGLGHFGHDHHHENGDDDHHHEDGGHDHHHENGGGSDFGDEGHSAHGDRGHKEYSSNHHYGKGGAGDYHNEKHESFSISGRGGHKKEFDEADSHGADYAKGHAFKGQDHGHKSENSKGEETDGYHKLFAKDEFKKDHDFNDGETVEGGFDKFGHGHAHHGSGAGGFKKGDSHGSAHHESEFGKGGFNEERSEDEHGVAHKGDSGHESFHNSHGDFGSQGEHGHGKGYGFEIKHR